MGTVGSQSGFFLPEMRSHTIVDSHFARVVIGYAVRVPRDCVALAYRVEDTRLFTHGFYSNEVGDVILMIAASTRLHSCRPEPTAL